MAKSSRESFQKRAREKARQEKQAEKRAKRRSDSSSDDEQLTKREEDVLMKEYAKLSAQHEAEQISTAHYNEERHRIFVELGLESDG